MKIQKIQFNKYYVNNDNFIILNIIFKQTCNNFFIHITDIKNKNIFVLNGGVSNLVGKHRGSIRSIEIISKILFKKIEKIEKFIKIPIRFTLILKTGANLLTNIFINILLNKLFFYKFIELVKIPHNGIKKKKKKRI